MVERLSVLEVCTRVLGLTIISLVFTNSNRSSITTDGMCVVLTRTRGRYSPLNHLILTLEGGTHPCGEGFPPPSCDKEKLINETQPCWRVVLNTLRLVLIDLQPSPPAITQTAM